MLFDADSRNRRNCIKIAKCGEVCLIKYLKEPYDVHRYSTEQILPLSHSGVKSIYKKTPPTFKLFLQIKYKNRSW